MSNPIDWAFDYWDHGYNPIPEKNKAPLVKWKRFQTERVSLELISEWWERWPDAGIGIVTGREAGLVVVDADDVTAINHCRLHLPLSPFRVRTSRGMHFLFRYPAQSVEIRHLKQEHSPLSIDILGDGGKTTGLGTIHESGYVYRLDDGADLVSVHDLPVYEHEWFPKPKRVATLIAKQPLPRGLVAQDSMTRADKYLNAIDGAGKGARDCHTHQVAASVVRDFGLTFEQGLSLLLPWNETRNSPPLAEDDIKRIVRSVLEHGRLAYGAKLAS